jgi:hypothetical protein
MAVKFLEPSGDADFAVADAAGLGFWNIVSGAAVATDFVHGTHVKSIKYRPANNDKVQTTAGVISDTGTRISLYIYIVALPSSTASMFAIPQTTTANDTLRIRITSGGVLQAWNNSSQVGSDGSTLSTGVWYRLSLSYTISSTTVNRFELYNNGVSDISLTNITLGFTTSSILQIGNLSANSTLDFRSSDHYVDDSSALTDPGNIWVTIKRPVSNGTAVEFTTQIGSGGSGYGSGHTPQENERPFSTTNGWRVSNTTRVTEEYTIEAASVGDIDMTGGTLIDMMGFIVASVNSTADSPVHRMIIGGTTFAKTMGTANAIFTQIAGSSTYPTGGTDIGIDAQFTTTPHQTRLYEAGVIMAFIPAAGSSSIKTQLGLAIASVKTNNGLAIASRKTWEGLA